MKALRTYGMLTTFALVLFVSVQLIWMFRPTLDAINVVAWGVFIAVAAAMIFVVVTEPKPKRRADWRVNKIGISYLAQGSRKQRVS